MQRRPPVGAPTRPSILLKDTRPAMVWYVLAVDLLAAAGLAAAVVIIGPAEIGETFRRPVLWMVAGLAAIADLYPLMPWMRDVRGRIRIHWSGAFALAVVLVGGPATVLLFPLIALAAASSLPSTLWRLGFNVSVLTLEGLAGVLVLHLIFKPWPAAADSLELLAAGSIVALVWEAVNVGLVCTAMVLLEGTDWRESLRIGWRRTGPWLAALAASPMIAHIALTAPELIPGLAVITVVVHFSIANLIRKTDEARTDQLTGLANRTAALETLEAGLSRHRREASVTLVMIDLDGFKAINDTYGHDAGDQVLAVVGTRIRAALPDGLLVARLGGDEFVVVGEEMLDPAGVAAAVRRAVRQPVAVADGMVQLDCSTGWEQASPGRDSMDVLRAADRNLYRAKSQRRSHDPAERTLAAGDGGASASGRGTGGASASGRGTGGAPTRGTAA